MTYHQKGSITMSEKKIRITKTQRFEDIIALLNGEPVKYGTDVPTAVGVLEHEMGLLAKKNSGENKKQTAAQLLNEQRKAVILEFLATKPDGATCTEVVKAYPDMESNQRVSALMRQLRLSGKVNAIEGKNGRTLFTLA